jgi:hypothetical protein
MIFGANAQNKNFRDAASQRKDTSERTKTSNKYAAKIASSKNTSVGTDSSAATSVQHEPRSQHSKSDNIKGSWEGYSGGASAYIQMNKSGYDNPSIQKARYQKYQASHKSRHKNADFTKIDTRSIINNMSSSYASGSSADKIQEINKRNNAL